MNWTELLRSEMDAAYTATDGLFAQVEDRDLSWKPATGDNWMTLGQLLFHTTTACGFCCRGFLTGEWGFPEGVDPSEMSPEEMLPPAENMPSVESVAQARELLTADRKVAEDSVAQAGEAKLAGETCAAPWDPRDVSYGQRFLQMIEHLSSHKAQLFYYLKLQGKPVNTAHLWGSAPQ